jgi:hypothetical protein
MIVRFLQSPNTRLLKLIGVAMIMTVLFSKSFADLTLSLLTPPLPPLHFCRVPTLQTAEESQNPIDIPHQCQGPEYDQLARALLNFASNSQLHDRTWGRRPNGGGIPANQKVLILGNSDTQQIAYTMACQSAAVVRQEKPGVLRLEFANNAVAILLTDGGESLRNVSSLHENFASAIQAQTGHSLDSFDAIVWGLLHDCGVLSEACPNTTQVAYFAAAEQFDGPMFFIGMMADARQQQALAIRDQMHELVKTDVGLQHHGPKKKLGFISGRRHISQVKLEGATVYGGDADNAHKTGKTGHRCTGAQGGHPDLLAFDVTEFLYHQLT